MRMQIPVLFQVHFLYYFTDISFHIVPAYYYLELKKKQRFLFQWVKAQYSILYHGRFTA